MESSQPPPTSVVGSFFLQDLVENLPLDTAENPNVEITCLEFWEENLYVGTSAHEILHFVSILSTPATTTAVEPPKPIYILASRLHPPSTPSSINASIWIKKILVLPTTSTALVLSSTGFLSFYTLPEFSPISGAPKLKEVAFIGGQDLNEVEEEKMATDGFGATNKRGKLVVVLAKGKLRVIRVGEAVRLVKDIQLKAPAIKAVRRDIFACIATAEDYVLVDVDNIRQNPLFPIHSGSGDEPSSPIEPAPEPAPTLALSRTPSGSSARTPSQSHPPRTSSLSVGGRERRNSSAAVSKESAGTIHNRSSSTGSVRGQAGRSSSRGRIPSSRGRKSPTAKPARLLHPESSSRPQSPSHPSSPGGGRGESAISSPSGSTKAPSANPGSGSTSSRKATAAPAPPVESGAMASKGPLVPHVASPNASEFLLTTGTRWEDPGVGLFVNVEGDVTRGTISFEKYPDEVLVVGAWVIATIAGRGIEVQKWDMEEGGAEDGGTGGFLEMGDEGSTLGISEVIGLPGQVVGGAMTRLKLEKLDLRPGLETTEDEDPVELDRRNHEERIVAERVSTIEIKVVAFKGKRICALVQSPLALRLDSQLPATKSGTPKTRIRDILRTLRKANTVEPSTERGFHEVAYIRQKCGLLLLGELLQLETIEDADIQPEEIILAEEALIESAIDPRVVLAIFGDGFIEDIVLGKGGVWVYGGIRLVFGEICAGMRRGSFRRDALLLLKRYLAVWRRKRGFGSIADEEEVFATVDVALIRVLLILDSPEYLSQKGSTLVPEGKVRAELYTLVDRDVEDFDRISSLLQSFGRLYVLSILLQNRKMYREVLVTWKKILEEGDMTGEFEDGEGKVKNYLLKLKDRSLVEEFGKWLVARNTKLGVQVFSDDKAKARFEPEKVLEILRENAPSAVRSYVNQLVEKGNTKYANDLILLHLDDLTKVLENLPSAWERLRDSYESYRALISPKPTYQEFIADNSIPFPEATDGATETELQDNWWRNRLRLLELLSGESPYDVAEVLRSLVRYREVLVPEMVILYGKEGRHEDAIRLLTHGLKDFDTAINYCLFGGLSIFHTRKIITDREEQRALFAVLLGEFLKLEDYKEQMEQTKLLLERFGGWVDVTHVLQVVPENWSVEMLSGFLMSALRGLVKDRAEARVMRGLRSGENFKVEAEYVGRCDELGPTIEG